MASLTEEERLRRHRRDQTTRRAREAGLREIDPEGFRRYRAKLNAQSREWKQANSYVAPRDPSRKQALQKIWKSKNRERVRAYANAHYKSKKRENEAFNLRLKFDSARARAKKRGLAFDITPADIVIPEVCPVLGIPIIWKTRTGKGDRDNAPALDRIRNADGYVKGNVQVISTRANRWKNDMTLDDVKKLAAYMELHEMVS